SPSTWAAARKEMFRVLSWRYLTIVGIARRCTGMSTGASAQSPSRHPFAAGTGVPVRPTARVRPTIPTRLLEPAGPIHSSDPYVRRYWVAALGPSAVTELLRFVTAASRGAEVRLPRCLPALLRTGLVKVVD